MVKLDLYGMYGNFECSCGCGRSLTGTCAVVYDDKLDDPEGIWWKCFTTDCAHRVKISCGSWDKVYKKYDVPKVKK